MKVPTSTRQILNRLKNNEFAEDIKYFNYETRLNENDVLDLMVLKIYGGKDNE